MAATAAAMLLPAVLLAPLSARPARAESPAAAGPGAEEPTGGRWATVVLASGDALPLPAPPADASARTRQELAELRALQAARTPEDEAAARFWDAGAALRWNEIARELVARHKTLPPRAARLYALLSVAQYDALVAAWDNKSRHDRPAPARLDKGITPLAAAPRAGVYPSEHAVVAAASAAVLAELFPGEADALAARAREHAHSRLVAGVNYRSDVEAGAVLGRAAAEQALRHARTDGADRDMALTVPPGAHAGGWFGTNPVLPLWGQVRPWLVPDVAALRPAPPPAPGSPEFNAALAEVRRISDTRTEAQLSIARFWADGPGTATPPGHWNQIACDLLAGTRWSEVRQARALALVNMAVMDAGVCCWDAKYAYWLIRPSQADPRITTPVGLPNFPAYTSGHSTFSGAAAAVLGYLFPAQARDLQAMADEAGMSRLYGGIHYRFDSEVGLEAGRAIGALAIQRAKADGAPGR